MPEMTGRDLGARLLLLRPDLRQLYMSGYTADAITHNGVLEEDKIFLPKPFSKKELAAKVRKALEKQ